MIRLVFSANRELIHFLVIEKNVYYTDRKWATWIRCLPKPENFIQKIKLSRNKFPSFLVNLFNFSEQEIAQYSAAKDEAGIADLIVADAKTKGCRLIVQKSGEIVDEQLKSKIIESELVADISQKGV